MNLRSADYESWVEYVTNELAAFYEHTEGVTYIFDHSPASAKYVARWHKRGMSTELAAFSGPWHVVRKLVTTEYRQWVEEYEATDRLTYTQWVERAKNDRVEVAWEESAERALDKLEMLRRLTLERDAIIVEAARKGATKVAIARSVGLSRQQIHVIIADAEASEVPDVAPFAQWETEVAPVAEIAPVAEWDLSEF